MGNRGDSIGLYIPSTEHNPGAVRRLVRRGRGGRQWRLRALRLDRTWLWGSSILASSASLSMESTASWERGFTFQVFDFV